MAFKQFMLRILLLFFTLTTLITFAIYILGSLFAPEAQFGYDSLLSPMFYAACCMVPSLVMWSRKELSPRGMILRKVLQFLLTEAVMLGLAFAIPVFDTSRPAVVLGIAGSVLVIFVLVFLFSWAVNSAQAKHANEELLAFQRLHGTDEQET